MRHFFIIGVLFLAFCLYSEEVKIEEYAAISSDTVSSVNTIFDNTTSKSSLISVSKKQDAPPKEETREIKSLPQIIIDSGTMNMAGNSVYVKFSKEFTEELADGKKPVVTVTPDSPGVSLYVTDKSAYGFTVRTYSGNSGFDFDWIAVGK